MKQRRHGITLLKQNILLEKNMVDVDKKKDAWSLIKIIKTFFLLVCILLVGYLIYFCIHCILNYPVKLSNETQSINPNMSVPEIYPRPPPSLEKSLLDLLGNFKA